MIDLGDVSPVPENLNVSNDIMLHIQEHEDEDDVDLYAQPVGKPKKKRNMTPAKEYGGSIPRPPRKTPDSNSSIKIKDRSRLSNHMVAVKSKLRKDKASKSQRGSVQKTKTEAKQVSNLLKMPYI